MNILNELLDGFNQTLSLYKQGENIFDMGNVNIFPSLNKQTSWRYMREGEKLHLSDGNHVFSFNLPQGEHESSFHTTRQGDLPLADFSKGKSGTAQVHRADPGSIYFTLQEGTRNPTYTFRHVGGEKWEVLPKKKRVKKEKIETVIPSNLNLQEQVKAGMLKELNEVVKQGFDFSRFGHNLDRLAGQTSTKAINSAVDTALLPGRIRDLKLPFNLPLVGNKISSPLLAAALGAGAGGLYHVGRRALYNTPEENAAEEGQHKLLKRMLFPAAALGGANLMERSLLDNPTHGGLGYYDKKQAKIPVGLLNDQSGPLVNPFKNVF